MVGHGFRLPCSDSEESDDDVLSVGPARPLVTAALLGGTGNSWTADDLYGTCCEQLDDFNWVIPAGIWSEGCLNQIWKWIRQTLSQMSMMSII